MKKREIDGSHKRAIHKPYKAEKIENRLMNEVEDERLKEKREEE